MSFLPVDSSSGWGCGTNGSPVWGTGFSGSVGGRGSTGAGVGGVGGVKVWLGSVEGFDEGGAMSSTVVGVAVDMVRK